MISSRVAQRVSAWLGVMVSCALSASSLAEEPRAQAGQTEHHAIHFVKISVSDPSFMEGLESAGKSLRTGHPTVILFDGQSVTALRMRLRNQKKTMLDDAEVPKEKQQALARSLGVAPSETPRTYLDLVQHLSKKGAKVFANREAVKQYGLKEGEIHPVATLITTDEISDILDRSGFCFTVGLPGRG